RDSGGERRGHGAAAGTERSVHQLPGQERPPVRDDRVRHVERRRWWLRHRRARPEVQRVVGSDVHGSGECGRDHAGVHTQKPATVAGGHRAMSYRLKRRAFLQGVGAGGLGLKIMLRNLEASAQTATSPPRLLLTHWPVGIVAGANDALWASTS